jgi:hypothetical protein
MSDDSKQRGEHDRSRISLQQEHEVRYWTEALGVTKEELEEAVRAVGPSADELRERVKGMRSDGQ